MQPGEPSYELYEKEREELLSSLKRRAVKLTQVLNELEGVTSNAAEGALYCMPRIRLSKKVIEVRLSDSAHSILLVGLRGVQGFLLPGLLCLGPRCKVADNDEHSETNAGGREDGQGARLSVLQGAAGKYRHRDRPRVWIQTGKFCSALPLGGCCL